nr:uncharacterized protein LOC129279514 [Lytechinus pictus]
MITGAIIGSSPIILASRSTSNWHLFVAFGISALAGRACLGILIIRNRFSSENLPIVLSMNNIVEAFGFFLGGYLSGFVADKFSSYDATFKLLASVDVLTFCSCYFPK